MTNSKPPSQTANNIPVSIVRIAPLLALLAIALFPFGWLGEIWPAFGALLSWHFDTVLAHAVGHMLIFSMLGIVLLYSFPKLLSHPLWYFGLIMLAALGQEGFQLLYKQRSLVVDDFRDLAIDLIVGGLVFAIAWLMVRRSTSRANDE
ncbi:MAG: hypothetical protein MI924_00630 [Chloroflexales bacterium]|nr:hypothetical protein [Chloroflexales bacterium]